MSHIRQQQQQQQQRCLWKRNDDFVGMWTNTKITHDDLQSNKYLYYYYEDIYPKFVHATGHRRCSRFVYIANMLVVVQEFVLSTYFLAWHRMMMILQQQQENNNINHSIGQEREKYQVYINASMISIYVALLLAVIVNSRAATHIASGTVSATTTNSTTMIRYKNKVFIRILDALLLSILLRFIAALLHHLTLSYSTDTVERCATTAMVIHVLFCDYNYANGYYQYYTPSKSSDCTKDDRSSTISLNEKKPGSDDNDSKNGTYNNIYHRHRTSFMGGTISLNAAFFATIVLVSRFQNIDSSTATTTTTFMSFTFISLSVILFAFYPTTRHNISVAYPATHSVFHWLITACIIISTVALLIVLDKQNQLQHELQESLQPVQQHYSNGQNYFDTQFESVYNSYTNSFLFVLTFLGFIIPIWKHYLSGFKVSIRGPWDIPTKESMVLDYRLS